MIARLQTDKGRLSYPIPVEAPSPKIEAQALLQLGRNGTHWVANHPPRAKLVSLLSRLLYACGKMGHEE